MSEKTKTLVRVPAKAEKWTAEWVKNTAMGAGVLGQDYAQVLADYHNATLQPSRDLVAPAQPAGVEGSEETDRGLRDFLHKLGQDLLEIENHCPCGARPESPNSHPHVGGCPVGRVIRRSVEFAKGRGALISSQPMESTEPSREQKSNRPSADTELDEMHDDLHKMIQCSIFGWPEGEVSKAHQLLYKIKKRAAMKSADKKEE